MLRTLNFSWLWHNEGHSRSTVYPFLLYRCIWRPPLCPSFDTSLYNQQRCNLTTSLNSFQVFPEGRPINLYRQRSPSLTADSHPVVLFWKQAWKHLSSGKKGLKQAKQPVWGFQYLAANFQNQQALSPWFPPSAWCWPDNLQYCH